MYLKSLDLNGFKSFAKKTHFDFKTPITAIVGPNGSGKSNVAEGFRFVLGEQSMKSLRSKRTEDLIFNGSRSLPRSSRASVKLIFDNRRNLLDLDFDDVELNRVIHRDSSTEYSINGSKVRLRDIIELLAKAKIGSSGHHIISQGESDRILNVNPRERKQMIEDALGLKIYQYKKDESIRKLGKTNENIEKVESLRREIKPHLKFLSHQVEKVKKSAALAEDLCAKYIEFFSREKRFINEESVQIDSLMSPLKIESDRLMKNLRSERNKLEKISDSSSKTKELVSLEQQLRVAREEKDKFARELGRVEGEVIAEERRMERDRIRGAAEQGITVRLEEVEILTRQIDSHLRDAFQIDELREIKSILQHVSDALASFLERIRGPQSSRQKERSSDERGVEELKSKMKTLTANLESATGKETKSYDDYQTAKTEIEMEKDSTLESERAVFALTTSQNEVQMKISGLRTRSEKLQLVEDEFKRELVEAVTLAGRAASHYEDFVIEIVEKDREGQDGRKKEIEKMKIRLEESGLGTNEEIMSEYEEVSERDAFLESEIDDLNKTALSLNGLIEELSQKLSAEFEVGIEEINKQFNNFFGIMFGGGSSSISVVRDKIVARRDTDLDLSDMEERMKEEEDERPAGVVEGVEINVSLPHKKIRGLEMLSGGERALTSIALIFAMSQVNPPPFIVLDETDAALDEANSKRYGDMIENLSKKSQLILITHNRETMSRAGVLYGVTMGADAVSQVLSVQFEEAVKVAK